MIISFHTQVGLQIPLFYPICAHLLYQSDGGVDEAHQGEFQEVLHRKGHKGQEYFLNGTIGLDKVIILFCHCFHIILEPMEVQLNLLPWVTRS